MVCTPPLPDPLPPPIIPPKKRRKNSVPSVFPPKKRHKQSELANVVSSGKTENKTYSGRRTKRETVMMKERLKNPLPVTRQDDLALSRRQGREMRTIQHWKSEMKKFRNVTTVVKVEDFKTLAIHQGSGKRKGCGIYCNKDEDYMVCPSCKVFVCHKSCLIPLYDQFGLKVPNIESDNWSCPNCTKE